MEREEKKRSNTSFANPLRPLRVRATSVVSILCSSKGTLHGQMCMCALRYIDQSTAVLNAPSLLLLLSCFWCYFWCWWCCCSVRRTNRVLVFALYKREAARLEQFLQRNNYDAVAVHGDKGQVRSLRVVACCFTWNPTAVLPYFLGTCLGAGRESG